MGQKTSATLLRLGLNDSWNSHWFADKSSYAEYLHKDFLTRHYLHTVYKKKFSDSHSTGSEKKNGGFIGADAKNPQPHNFYEKQQILGGASSNAAFSLTGGNAKQKKSLSKESFLQEEVFFSNSNPFSSLSTINPNVGESAEFETYKEIHKKYSEFFGKKNKSTKYNQERQVDIYKKLNRICKTSKDKVNIKLLIYYIKKIYILKKNILLNDISILYYSNQKGFDLNKYIYSTLDDSRSTAGISSTSRISPTRRKKAGGLQKSTNDIDQRSQRILRRTDFLRKRSLFSHRDPSAFFGESIEKMNKSTWKKVFQLGENSDTQRKNLPSGNQSCSSTINGSNAKERFHRLLVLREQRKKPEGDSSSRNSSYSRTFCQNFVCSTQTQSNSPSKIKERKNELASNFGSTHLFSPSNNRYLSSLLGDSAYYVNSQRKKKIIQGLNKLHTMKYKFGLNNLLYEKNIFHIKNVLYANSQGVQAIIADFTQGKYRQNLIRYFKILGFSRRKILQCGENSGQETNEKQSYHTYILFMKLVHLNLWKLFLSSISSSSQDSLCESTPQGKGMLCGSRKFFSPRNSYKKYKHLVINHVLKQTYLGVYLRVDNSRLFYQTKSDLNKAKSYFSIPFSSRVSEEENSASSTLSRSATRKNPSTEDLFHPQEAVAFEIDFSSTKTPQDLAVAIAFGVDTKAFVPLRASSDTLYSNLFLNYKIWWSLNKNVRHIENLMQKYRFSTWSPGIPTHSSKKLDVFEMYKDFRHHNPQNFFSRATTFDSMNFFGFFNFSKSLAPATTLAILYYSHYFYEKKFLPLACIWRNNISSLNNYDKSIRKRNCTVETKYSAREVAYQNQSFLQYISPHVFIPSVPVSDTGIDHMLGECKSTNIVPVPTSVLRECSLPRGYLWSFSKASSVNQVEQSESGEHSTKSHNNFVDVAFLRQSELGDLLRIRKIFVDVLEEQQGDLPICSRRIFEATDFLPLGILRNRLRFSENVFISDLKNHGSSVGDNSPSTTQRTTSCKKRSPKSFKENSGNDSNQGERQNDPLKNEQEKFEWSTPLVKVSKKTLTIQMAVNDSILPNIRTNKIRHEMRSLAGERTSRQEISSKKIEESLPSLGIFSTMLNNTHEPFACKKESDSSLGSFSSGTTRSQSKLDVSKRSFLWHHFFSSKDSVLINENIGKNDNITTRDCPPHYPTPRNQEDFSFFSSRIQSFVEVDMPSPKHYLSHSNLSRLWMSSSSRSSSSRKRNSFFGESSRNLFMNKSISDFMLEFNDLKNQTSSTLDHLHNYLDFSIRKSPKEASLNRRLRKNISDFDLFLLENTASLISFDSSSNRRNIPCRDPHVSSRSLSSRPISSRRTTRRQRLPLIDGFNFIWNDSSQGALPLPGRNIDKSRFSPRNSFHVDFIINHHWSKTYNASLFILYLSRFLISFIKQNQGGKNKFTRLKNSAYKTLFKSLLREKQDHLKGQPRILGIGFYFSGRVYGAKKAASFRLLFGSVPFNTLDIPLDYSSIMQKTRNGTWGFRAWLHFVGAGTNSQGNSMSVQNDLRFFAFPSSEKSKLAYTKQHSIFSFVEKGNPYGDSSSFGSSSVSSKQNSTNMFFSATKV